MKSYQYFAFFIALFLKQIYPTGAQLTYRTNPIVEWSVQTQNVRDGNGIFLSPGEEMLLVSTRLGYIQGFRPNDGSEIFTYVYKPKSTDVEFIDCSSGIAFGSNYFVYSIIVNQFSDNPVSRVVALTMSGEELWVSPSLDGVTPGTPVISENGEFVFLTHNSDGETVGHFTILSGSSGQVFFNETDLGAPFAPLGIHYNPAEGYYDGGQNNRNDILVWSVQPKPSDTSVGPGATFAFQFPIGFSGNPDGLSYTPLGATVKDFQAIQKPIFTNEGRTMYWGNSRSQFRCWIGAPGVNQNRFSRGRTAILGFSRGDPPRQAVFAPPVLSHNESDLYVFGATAAKEFVRMNADFSDEILVATTSQVKTQAHVSPDDAFVYYVEGNGQVHQARTEDLVDNWIFDLGKPVEGSSALNENGTILYVADATGLVKALRIGDVPTNAPTTAPSNLPTVAPSWVPTSNPTSRPTEGSTPTPSQVEPTFNGSKLIGGNPNDDSSETDTSGGSEVVLTSVLMLLIPFFLL